MAYPPFRIRVTLQNLERIMKQVDDQMSRRIMERLYEIMRTNMQEAVEEAKKNIVMQGLVKTGTLLNSIAILEENPSQLYVIGGTNVWYAHFPEFGTVKMHARPYWRFPVWLHFFNLFPLMKQAIEEERRSV